MRNQRRQDVCMWKFVSSLVCLLLAAPVLLAQGTGNIKSIKSVGSNVEITVTSGQEFEVRNEGVILQIGDSAFSNSRSPDDGDLHVLTFVLTSQEFDQLSSGDPVTVRFGSDPSNDRRNCGKLDKSILNK